MTLFTVSGHGQDTLITGSRAGASPHVPLLPVLVHRKILGVSWSDAASPHGLCRALQVRSTEPSAARVARAFLGWWEGCPAPCRSHPNWYSLILGSLGGSWWVPLSLQPVSSTVCREQSCCLGGEGKLQGIKKCQGTAQNNIFWVTSGSCWQESSRQKCDKKMQHCEMVFASRMEEEGGRLPWPGTVSGHHVLVLLAPVHSGLRANYLNPSSLKEGKHLLISHQP